jgi:tRNA modification GTPase
MALLTDTAGLHDAPSDMVEEIGIARAQEALDQADLVLWLDEAPPSASAVPHILIHPRADVAGRGVVHAERLPVSARTGEGVVQLWDRIAEAARAMLPANDAIPLNRRQRDLAALAAAALRRAGEGRDPLLIAEDLRHALRAFDRITGAADVEAMLDTLFGRFCIGK